MSHCPVLFLRCFEPLWKCRLFPVLPFQTSLHFLIFPGKWKESASHSDVSDSLRPRGLQHTRLRCPSPSSRAFLKSCALNRWCHPTISSSAVLFSCCLQSFLTSGSFLSQLFISGGQSIGTFSFRVSPSNEYSGLIFFRIDWLDLLAVQGTPKSLLQHHSSKASILWCSAFFIVQLSHPYMTTGKTVALTRRAFVSKVMSLLFNMLFRCSWGHKESDTTERLNWLTTRLVIAFLPRSKRLLISWLQSPSAVIWEHKKIKSVTVCIVSPSPPCSNGTRCHNLSFLNVEVSLAWLIFSCINPGLKWFPFLSLCACILSCVQLFATPILRSLRW